MITSFLTALVFAVSLPETKQDTLKVVTLDEINITSNIKETGTLRQQPASSSYISALQMAANGTDGMKSIGSLAPNFFVPDYGSKQTSAIYMRGIGSRIGTPAVGLYVDNVPYYDKSAFDFSFYDVESIDVMRGPQSTLYGRNAMSGLIRVHTRNPFHYVGTDVRLGYATKENRRQASLTHYHRVSDAFAFSAGGFYDSGDGFFRNSYTGKKVDGMESGGGRIRAIWKLGNRLKLDANVGYEYSDEGTYPYYYCGAENDTEEYQDLIGMISSNLEGRYRRGLFNASINAEYKTDCITLNSVTAYQNINDRMLMDQDFLSADIYSLGQKQNINTISEELLLKNNGSKAWNWLLGANVFYQSMNIKAPVTFRKDGVDWLNSTINTNANAHMPSIPVGLGKMDVVFSDNIQGNSLRFNDNFNTPTTGLALFHQSTFNNILGIDGLSVSGGIRLDYESMKMDYDAWYDFEHIYSIKGVLPLTHKEVSIIPEKIFNESNASLNGSISHDFFKLLPKISIMYRFDRGNVYGTVSRGFRSGGYNAQNISEILRAQMQSDMMKSVIKGTVDALKISQIIPENAKDIITDKLGALVSKAPADVRSTCSYSPEYAWNYEVGTHLDFLDRKFTLDMSAFVSEISDLQLSRMSETGLGRTIINAGKSRSMGFEAAMRLHPVKALSIGAAYGYTHATFREYSVYDNAEKKDIDCHGNYVPYIPSSTLNLDAAYAFQLNGALQTITIGANYSLVGKIYWDEQNMHSQSSYGLLGGYMQLAFKRADVQLWARNITDTKYNTFWFESMSRGFEQHGKPIQFGATLSMHL